MLAADRLARINRLREQLEPAGFLTEPAGDWSSLARHLQQVPADAILGDFDELAEAATFCTRLRSAGIGVPLLVLLPTDKCMHRDSLMKLGAQGCLPRSTETGLLREEVENLCSAPALPVEPAPLILRSGIPPLSGPDRPQARGHAPDRYADPVRPAATSEPAIRTLLPPPQQATSTQEACRMHGCEANLPTSSLPASRPDAAGQDSAALLVPFAAGVAHGFSECLTAIVGYANLLLEAPNMPHLPRRDAESILKAASQGTQLTRRLLAIGLKQVLHPIPTELNGTLIGLQPAIKDLAGPRSEVRLELERSLPRVFVDPTALRQALLDLVAFVSGVQGPGGTLGLHSSLAPAVAGESEPREVQLTLARTDLHLDDDALGRLFVPFGRAAPSPARDGLLLASVQGTLLQSGGSIRAERTTPSGFQFVLRLPPASPEETHPEAPETETLPSEPAATGTILLADDEELLRGIAVRILEEAGYRVLVAQNGIEALELAHQFTGRVDMLLTDVVMPKMGGFELATRLRTRHPHVKVLFMSGFSEGGLFPQQGERSGLMFLQKPFSPALLLSRIRSIMVERVPAGAAPAPYRD